MSKISKPVSKFLIYLTVFFDRFGLFVVLPIFATLIFVSNEPIVALYTPLEDKFIILGFLLASYPFAGFIGSPIFEQVSLKFGEKPTLIISMAIKTIGAFLTAHGLLEINLSTLFIGRFIMGFPGMSQFLVLRSLESKELSHKKLSYHTAFTGLGFIAAIFLGGWFSDATRSAEGSFYLPLWILAIIYIAQGIVYLALFPSKKPSSKKLNIEWFKCFTNIKRAFHTKSIRAICLVYFFIVFAWMTTLQFNSVYLIEKFNAVEWTITSVYLAMAIIWAISAWVFDSSLSRTVSVKNTLAINLGLMTCCSGLALFAPNLISYYIAVCFMSVFVAFAWGAALKTKFIRTEVHSSENKSTSQSMNALALTIGPILIGYLIQYDIALLHLLGAASAFSALWIHQKYYKQIA